MPASWRALRRRVLTPNVAETRMSTRGFRPKNEAARELLEAVGLSFVTGFGAATGARGPDDCAARLEQIPRDLRGFSYEGATMGFSVMDGFAPGRRAARFIAGPAEPHIYMAFIGVGWAMARVPRPRWKAMVPPDPLLRWLVLDGYGFHQAYFRTQRFVREQYRDPRFPWPAGGPAGYANRVIDQGIGRALWFVEGTDPVRVADAIDSFAPDRHADLYSGAGLAATYAGGADDTELATFLARSGAARPWVAQACAFAAKARLLAGLANAHTQRAAAVFCGTTAEKAAAVTDDALVDLPADGPVPAFESWRQRIAAAFEPQQPVPADRQPTDPRTAAPAMRSD